MSDPATRTHRPVVRSASPNRTTLWPEEGSAVREGVGGDAQGDGRVPQLEGVEVPSGEGDVCRHRPVTWLSAGDGTTQGAVHTWSAAAGGAGLEAIVMLTTIPLPPLDVARLAALDDLA